MMKNTIRNASISTVLALWITLPAIAEAKGLLGSTYLTTITLDGAFASRSMITFHFGRTMSVVDSAQISSTLKFSGQQGVWKKRGGRVVGRTIDFTFAPDAGIARADYDLTMDTKNDTISGTIELRVYEIGGDPQNDDGDLIGTFDVIGERITVKRQECRYLVNDFGTSKSPKSTGKHGSPGRRASTGLLPLKQGSNLCSRK